MNGPHICDHCEGSRKLVTPQKRRSSSKQRLTAVNSR